MSSCCSPRSRPAFSVLRSRTLLESGEAAARAGVDAARNGDRVRRACNSSASRSRISTTPRIGSDRGSRGPRVSCRSSARSCARSTPSPASAPARSPSPGRRRRTSTRTGSASRTAGSTSRRSRRTGRSSISSPTRPALVRARLDRLPRMWLVSTARRPTPTFRHHRVPRRRQRPDRRRGRATGSRPPRGLAATAPTSSRSSRRPRPGARAGSWPTSASSPHRTAASIWKASAGVPISTAGAHQPKHLTGPPDYLARYAKFEPAQTWENVTMSPDFPSVGDVMAQLYPQSGGGHDRRRPPGRPVRDGATADAHRARSRCPGLPVTIDANNAVSFLLRDEYTIITDPIRRSNLLGDVAKAVFKKLTTRPVGPALGARPGAEPAARHQGPRALDEGSGRAGLRARHRRRRRAPARPGRLVRRHRPERGRQQDRQLSPADDPLLVDHLGRDRPGREPRRRRRSTTARPRPGSRCTSSGTGSGNRPARALCTSRCTRR